MSLSNHFLSDGYAPPTPNHRSSLPLLERARVAQRDLGFGKNIFFTSEGTLYIGFKPSLHFEAGLVDDTIFAGLCRNKRALCVGVGQASFEQLLVRFGVPYSNLVLADRAKYSAAMHEDNAFHPIPDEFEFVEFSIFGRWPRFPSKFDYVLFPQSFDVGVSSAPALIGSPTTLSDFSPSARDIIRELFTLRRKHPDIHLDLDRLSALGLYQAIKENVPPWLLAMELGALSDALDTAAAGGQIRFSGTQTPYYRLCYYLSELRASYSSAEAYEFLTIIEK